MAVAIAVGAGVWHGWPETIRRGLAGEAVVTASSTRLGTSARALVSSGSAARPGAGWDSDRQTVGAWVELDWPAPHELRRLTVVRSTLDEPGPSAGYLSFSDGSFLQFSLSATARSSEVIFSPRRVDRVRLTVSAVDSGATSVSLAELVVSSEAGAADVELDGAVDGNVAPSAEPRQGPGAGSTEAAALVDGSTAEGGRGVGQAWRTDQPTGAWVELAWLRPRELVSIAIVGVDGAAARPSRLTVTFADGARLPVGEVLADPSRPTVVSFMPRVTTSVRLALDGATGPGDVALGEVRAYQRGASLPRTRPTRDPVHPPSPVCPGPQSPAPTGLLVRCPLSGSTVDTPMLALEITAPGYSDVTATAWPADGSDPGGPARSPIGPTGAATVPLDVSRVGAGPFTVKVEARGRGRPTRSASVTLSRSGARPAERAASQAPAHGRTLVYADEFEGPVSVTRTGAGADYAAGKPTHVGAEDFGDAIFADPALGLGNLAVVDGQHLRIAVQPNRPGFRDPQGWGRTRTGGLLAAARPGGSGMGVQYGYFEARMLASAGPGTWPAFWLLPSDNLIRPQPAVAEIDAVELYGHEPTGACHSTHEYVDGKDGGVAECGRRFPDERAAMAWHAYGVSVSPTEITFFIDGLEVATSPQVQGGGSPMFFLVNLALGGGWPIDLQPVQDRAVLYVDHVRVFV